MKNLQNFVLTAILFLLSFVFSTSIKAQNAGSLDTTFGSGGTVNYQVGNPQNYRDSVIQPDKKIVVAVNYTQTGGSTSKGAALRFNENGTFDQTFFNNVSGSQVYLPFANAVALQPDGKVLVGGNDLNTVMRIIRYNASGSVDTTFGTNGMATMNLGASTANSLNVLPDGKIIAVGWVSSPQGGGQKDFTLVKFNANGTLDTTFGTNGIVIIDLGSPDSTNEIATDSEIQTDGKIVIAGTARNSSNEPNATILRYNANGTLDTTFGTNGKITSGNNVNFTQPVKIAIQTDGKINVAATGIQPARYNSDGSPDRVFGTPNWSYTAAVAVQPGGKVLFSGYTSNDSNGRLARYNNDGSLDLSFGTNGIVMTGSYVQTILNAPDGKIITATSSPNFQINVVRYLNNQAISKVFDFDRDGKTDIGIYRPSNGSWWINSSSTNLTLAVAFGTASDKIVPADYTGDGKADMALFRPSTGGWFILRSEDYSYYGFPFGISEDIPAPGDFDGDGKIDAAVFRPSTSAWYILQTSDGSVRSMQFGLPEDQPVVADYDGDGKDDIAIFRPVQARWWILKSSGGINAVQFGQDGDKVIPGDYTGDGKTDIAVWRPSNSFWYILRSEDASVYGFPFGLSTDIPTPGDYDGDGKMDAALFRDSNYNWYLLRSTSGFDIVHFGTSGDKPIPNSYVR